MFFLQVKDKKPPATRAGGFFIYSYLKADLFQKEPEMLKIWEEMHIYKKIREVSKGREVYILREL